LASCYSTYDCYHLPEKDSCRVKSTKQSITKHITTSDIIKCCYWVYGCFTLFVVECIRVK
jgi:hypothetical protein